MKCNVQKKQTLIQYGWKLTFTFMLFCTWAPEMRNDTEQEGRDNVNKITLYNQALGIFVYPLNSSAM